MTFDEVSEENARLKAQVLRLRAELDSFEKMHRRHSSDLADEIERYAAQNALLILDAEDRSRKVDELNGELARLEARHAPDPFDRYILEPDGRTIHVDVPRDTSITIGRFDR